MSPEISHLLARLIEVCGVLYLYVRVLRIEDAIRTIDADRKLHCAATEELIQRVIHLEEQA